MCALFLVLMSSFACASEKADFTFAFMSFLKRSYADLVNLDVPSLTMALIGVVIQVLKHQ